MTKEIILPCCEGSENYNGQCLKTRCPIYKEAQSTIGQSWPYLATGFGNAYGYPKHQDYMREVQNQTLNEELVPTGGLILSLESTPRGRKKHRRTEILATMPTTSGVYETEDSSVIESIVENGLYGTKVTVKAEGPITERPYLGVLQDGLVVNIVPDNAAKVPLTGTKRLIVALNRKGSHS